MSSAVMASRGQWTGSLMNPVCSSRDRHMPAWGPCSVHGGGVGEFERASAFAFTPIWVSQRLEEREREWWSSDWLTSLLLHYHYFSSQSLRGDSGRLCTRKCIRFSPCNHMCAQTHVCTLTPGERKCGYDRRVKGYHYKWLTLTFSHPKGMLITLALSVSHTCT